MPTPDSQIHISKQHVVLFGGAFNPPHLGHLIVIQQAFGLISNLDELWLLPDNISHFDKNLAASPHRLEMAKLLIDELPSSIQSRIRLKSLLIDDKLPGETYDYLKVLKQKYPSHRFSFLMGSDNVKVFEKWGNWQKLLEILPFYIYPRNGHRVKKLYPHMTLLESDTQIITNFSSEIIRHRLQQGLSLQNLIPSSILDYLSTHGLYLPPKA